MLRGFPTRVAGALVLAVERDGTRDEPRSSCNAVPGAGAQAASALILGLFRREFA